MHLCMQSGKYDGGGDAATESAQAAAAGLSWYVRGPTDDRPEWRGQKRRPNGRYANKGGFRKRVAEVYRASGQNWFYSLNNEEGPCACMHIPYIYTPDCEPCFQQGCIHNYMYKCTLIMTAQAWQMSPWAMDPWGRAGPRGHGPWAMAHGVLSVLHASNLV